MRVIANLQIEHEGVLLGSFSSSDTELWTDSDLDAIASEVEGITNPHLELDLTMALGIDLLRSLEGLVDTIIGEAENWSEEAAASRATFYLRKYPNHPSLDMGDNRDEAYYGADLPDLEDPFVEQPECVVIGLHRALHDS